MCYLSSCYQKPEPSVKFITGSYQRLLSMNDSHGDELIWFRREERGLGSTGEELHDKTAAHTEAALLKEVRQSLSRCPYKLNPPIGDVAGYNLDIFGKNFPHVFLHTYFFQHVLALTVQ